LFLYPNPPPPPARFTAAGVAEYPPPPPIATTLTDVVNAGAIHVYVPATPYAICPVSTDAVVVANVAALGKLLPSAFVARTLKA
jgi:hypothetical protein